MVNSPWQRLLIMDFYFSNSAYPTKLMSMVYRLSTIILIYIYFYSCHLSLNH